MPCGKKPVVKKWDHPKNIKVVKPSRYQKNEASVKVYWESVIKDLEMSYKDEQFWDTQTDIVRTLVGPVIFERIAKIFNLPVAATPYQAPSETFSSPPDSEQFYVTGRKDSFVPADLRPEYSMSDYEPSEEEQEEEEEVGTVDSVWTDPSDDTDLSAKKSSKSIGSKRLSTTLSSKSFSKVLSKIFTQSKVFRKSQNVLKTYSSKTINKSKSIFNSETFDKKEDSARTDDDLDVHADSVTKRPSHRKSANPHFDMLYCNESETDMIKWNSKYKQKTFEISASDEFSKKAELLTKQIAHDFFEWWTGLGNVEFKSEIKRPEDIEELFQVWFDEHASRGIKFDPKILPCVLPVIANSVGVPKASCPYNLKKEIASDVHAEISPAHTMAFGTALPLKMKHIPPQNNTKEIWHCLKIPQDLKSMAAVWEEIQHLTSTKAFQKWLEGRPHMPMPPCFRETSEKRQPFIVPSDMVLRRKSTDDFSSMDLAMPISQFSIEIKEVLSKLLND